jgi:hypothetical protein
MMIIPVVLWMLFSFMLFLFYLGYRNDLIFNIRNSAIKAIYESMMTDKRFDWDLLDSPTYNEMIFQFSKSTPEQFYPELFKKG